MSNMSGSVEIFGLCIMRCRRVFSFHYLQVFMAGIR